MTGLLECSHEAIHDLPWEKTPWSAWPDYGLRIDKNMIEDVCMVRRLIFYYIFRINILFIELNIKYILQKL